MMMFDPKTNIAMERHWRLQLQGTGAAVPTVLIGHGITLTRPAIGRILLTFAENPGTFVGIDGATFRDSASQATVKGWTCTAGAYPQTANTFTFEIDLWSSTFAAVDLAATSFLDLDITFSELKNP